MAGEVPDFIEYIDDPEIDDGFQLIEDQDGVVVEFVEGDDDGGGDEGDSDYDEGDDDDSDGEEEGDGLVPPPPAASRVSRVNFSTNSQEVVINQGSENVVEEDENSQRRMAGGEASSSQGGGRGGEGGNESGGEWSKSEIDGLFCPICMDAWTNSGDHQVSCLPCGHLYGASCIKKWLQQRKNSGKCPQCNRRCALKDVRVIYAPQIVVVDQEVQKNVRSLEAKCASFEKKENEWHRKEVEWRRRETDLSVQVNQLMKRTRDLENLLAAEQNRHLRLFNANKANQDAMIGHNFGLEFTGQASSSNFILQKELQVDGAKFFDLDASSQIFILARKLSGGMGGTHVLTKMSLMAPYEREDVQLPVNTKAVRDLSVAPDGKRVLVASLGKKLSVVSTESNNIVVSYDLQAAAWSCSWDIKDSHYVYAGLQNGRLLVFDLRQTLRPVESMVGLACNPIHSIHTLSPDHSLPSGVKSILTASSIGVCQWNFGGVAERPFFVPESENQGVCIALAYSPSSNHIVATFRPKVEMSTDMALTQPSLTPATSLVGQAVQGSHVLYKREGNGLYQRLGSTYANVSGIRLPKSVIMDRQNHLPQLVSGDEVTSELVLQELPSFMVDQKLKSRTPPIRDVKYTHNLGFGVLSCLNDGIVQIFSTNTL
ncbi:hypothetical protein NMG60_11000632 [Bertholletia excelsa]